MIFDRSLMFSNAQAITETAASDNIVDLLATGRPYGHAQNLVKDVGKGNQIALLVQVVEAFNTLTSLTIELQCDDNEAFASPKTVLSHLIPLEELIAGKTASITSVPPGINERYLRLHYVVAGSNPTLGRITASVVAGVQTNAVNF
ncbi:MAG: hypothetical protein IT544_00480 [Rhodobacteraceae bacterium]|nr:hypothetical protein [Paracoccaceae bacterium]